jgi:hypothetical protein
MKHVPLEHILNHQTGIVQELALYLHDGQYVPTAKDLNLLEDIAIRADDTNNLCRFLEREFFRRLRTEE